MEMQVWIGVFAGVLFAALSAGAADVTISPDRMLVVDGQRTFVLGLYEYPGDDVVLDDVKAAGFNLVHASEDVAQLDRLQAAGLFAWINTGGRIDLGVERESREAALKTMTETYGAHPALLVWEVPDEALWNVWYGASQWRQGAELTDLRARIAKLEDKALGAALESQLQESGRLYGRGDFAGSEGLADDVWRKLGAESPHPDLNLSNASERAAKLCAGMVAGYQALRQLDPHHPVWMNHAPRNQISQLAAFDAGADIVGCDIYPVPEYRVGHSDLADRSMASVGAFTDRMQAAAPGKPVWMVLQGFGWADLAENPPDEKALENGRRPKLDETRFMAYDAIVRGARGLLYWGTYRVEKDASMWADLRKVVRELADLGMVLAAPDTALTPRVTLAESMGSMDRGVVVLGKDVGGAIWWLVVNEYPGSIAYRIESLESLEGTKYADPVDEREVSVEGGALSLAIRGHGVQVLAPAAR